MEGKTYEFRIDMDPVPKGRPRFTSKGRAYTPKATVIAETEIKRAVSKQFRAAPLEGPLYVGMAFYIKRPKSVKRALPVCRPDIDNYIKMMDALNKLVWLDDSQIVDISASKRYTPGPAYIEIQVTEL